MLNKTTANVTVKNDENQQMVRVQQMKKAAGALSIDDVISSDITISRKLLFTSSCHKISAGSYCTSSREQQRYIQPVASSIHPVARLSTSRKLQRFVYPVDMESSRKKADVVESYYPDARYPVVVFEASAVAQSIQSTKKQLLHEVL
ncbi:hypothetical protein F511_17962 [Dorcoceras hygrometricum]|uniref:Uncharacterized protein n=1 Tax=Dorcoceras hygrometricum TaxID=472368 RepID=A0A2Z7AKC4_9LAMI|nr:hypothetical protein F511_17962 [Dorcoceras hygrometricum]